MKKVLCFISVIVFSLTIFIPMEKNEVNAASKANTLAELRKELTDWKNKATANDNKKKATQNQITNAKNSVSNKQGEIITNQQKINDSLEESAKLEVEIENGKKELATLVKNYQTAQGDNLYLEYIFEAKSYEDLVYRYAVMEQIMNYQDSKITSWKEKIEQNIQLKKDLEAREVLLNKQIKDLAVEIDDLKDELEDYFDIELSIKDEISSTEALIKYYEKLGCGENESLEACAKVKGDTGFMRPVAKGTITSVWGYRTHPVTGVANTFHNGIDIGGTGNGANIWSAANGMVGKIIYKASCGGNQVYIYHTINGAKFTTTYLHMKYINVKLGQAVTNQTVIGGVGGAKGTGDSCTTGTHLHFGMATGWYGTDYVSSSKFKAHSVNPASKVNFPSKGKWFYSRV